MAPSAGTVPVVPNSAAGDLDERVEASSPVADGLPTSGVVMVVGKGGVGSTTVTSALAVALGRAGADVLVVSVDGRSDIGRLIGERDLDTRDRVLRRFDGGGAIRGRFVQADQAFDEYMDMRGVGGLLRRAASAASLPMIAAATPGLEHLLVLGKVKELEAENAADVIIVDAPPAGHAAPFLRAPFGLSDVISDGPVREQADEVAALLGDHDRCRAVVVALPEVTPVTEAIELATDIRDDLGIALAPVVVNACWPDRPGLAKTPAMAARSHPIKLDDESKAALAAAADFGRARMELQAAQLARVRDEVGPPISVPRLVATRLGHDEIETLAEALAG